MFTLNYAGGQLRPTNHLYKMTLTNGTTVMGSEPVFDSMFLSLAKFQKIQNGEFNPYILVDVIVLIVSLGELQNLEANNKHTTKLEFEIRDETLLGHVKILIVEW
uniref:Uncharacterized protein n=1 Tax=Arabidopsis thaliana TaxID=3702 RepID=Q0WMN9_ARATH|nr:hypothetical protein [Arabidopsis thaliana]